MSFIVKRIGKESGRTNYILRIPINMAEEAGIKKGDYVAITVEGNRLVITKVEVPKTS